MPICTPSGCQGYPPPPVSRKVFKTWMLGADLVWIWRKVLKTKEDFMPSSLLVNKPLRMWWLGQESRKNRKTQTKTPATLRSLAFSSRCSRSRFGLPSPAFPAVCYRLAPTARRWVVPLTHFQSFHRHRSWAALGIAPGLRLSLSSVSCLRSNASFGLLPTLRFCLTVCFQLALSALLRLDLRFDFRPPPAIDLRPCSR